MDQNELIKSLAQVPELVKLNKTLIEENEKKFSMLAELAQRRMQAEIPQGEIEKHCRQIMNTPCAMPDTFAISHEIARSVNAEIASSAGAEAAKAAKEAVEKIPVRVEHVHAHTTLWELRNAADEKLKAINTAFLFLLAFCLSILGVTLYGFLSSEEYIGAQYATIAFSKYTTEAEQKDLLHNAYNVSFLPSEFRDSPKTVKERIKHNRQIIKDREKQARANKGKWKSTIPVER